MSLKIDKIQLEMIINNDPARKAIRELEAETKKLRQEMKKIPEGTKEWNDKFSQLKQAENKLERLKSAISITSMTTRELAARQKELNAILRNLDPNTKEWKALNAEMLKIKARQAELRGSVNKTHLSIGKIADGFNKYFGVLTAGIATLAGMVFSFRKVIDSFNEFEKKLSRLSALTGLMGADLNWMGDQAKKMSTDVVEGGVRITQSADQIVDAFTKVGSARPELLKNKDALKEVTQEAIILSEASGDELQPAVEALAMVLNQFNVPATESRRIINALAAGSKEGAGEIPYLTTAFEKAGTVAADAGISIEELIGIVETLAPRITQPEIAGRSLKGVILDLQKTADDTNPAIVGFSQAIENLGNKNLSTIELTKLFGDENITTAKILLNNVGELNKYTDAVTGTNVAIEQATINTDNNSARLDQARNKIKLLSIELGERLAPALTFSTSGFSYLLKATLAVIKFFDQYGKTILSVVAGITAYTVAVNFSSITTKLYTTATLLAEKATKLFNLTMKSNPIGLAIGLVTSLVTALTFLATRTQEATEKQKELNEAIKEGNKIIESSKSLEERAKLLDQMSKSGLERFKSDAESQLQEIDKLDEKKLLAAKKYQEEVVKLEQWMSDNAKDENEKRALYQNQYVTAERDKAFAHLQTLNQMVTDSNAEQLKSYVALAEEKLKLDTPDLKVSKSKDKFDPSNIGSEEINSIIALNEQKRNAYQEARKDSIIDLEKAYQEEARLRQTKHNEELAKLDNDEEARIKQTNHNKELAELAKYEESKKQLKEQFRQEELARQIQFLNQVVAEANEIINNGGIESLSLEESLLTDEEKDSLLNKIDELKLKLSELKLEMPNGDIEDGEGTDIFGMSPEAWDTLWEKVGIALKVAGEIGQIWDSVNQKRSAQENEELRQFEANTNKRKQILQKQHDSGLLSEQAYNSAIESMDSELDQKRKKLEVEQAKRARTAAVFQILLSTGMAVMNAANTQPFMPMGLIMMALAAAVGAVQLATLPPVPSYAQGNYANVVGNQDGKKYRAKVSSPSHSSGYYDEPTYVPGFGLFGETGKGNGELVFNPEDTQKVLNSPGLINAINATLGNQPQYAQGNTREIIKESTSTSFTDPELLSAIKLLNANIERGIRANLVADESYIDTHKKVISEHDQFLSKVTA